MPIENVIPESRSVKNLPPKISTIVPVIITGNRDAIATKNQKLPKTLPLKPPGVFSCRNVCVVMVNATKEIPNNPIKRKPTTILATYGNSGIKKVIRNSDKVI